MNKLFTCRSLRSKSRWWKGIKEIPQERFPEQTVKQIETARPAPVVEDVAPAPVIEPSALEALQNIIHEKQVEVDRCVQMLKRETEKLRLLEECSFAPPRDLEELRRAIQAGKDALAVAMRDLHGTSRTVCVMETQTNLESWYAASTGCGQLRDGNRLPGAAYKYRAHATRLPTTSPLPKGYGSKLTKGDSGNATEFHVSMSE